MKFYLKIAILGLIVSYFSNQDIDYNNLSLDTVTTLFSTAISDVKNSDTFQTIIDYINQFK